ncbi:hypothetical protein SAMN04488513_10335 [Pseudozobellia thermophila]|uniref:Lipocalin-like domain-containing protein n=2 Tax=Pseudozobellia thermophila TaxID=192903 RepID=A0A1M6HFM5_9FLAO|nr:hypothetical protein SAMN04488513_10335 [Pseudozobellia thermophila]
MVLGLIVLGSSLLGLQAMVHPTLNSCEFPALHEDAKVGEGLEGVWRYTVNNAPPEYSKGSIAIVKEEGSYGVEVHLAEGSLKGFNVAIEGNSVSFDLTIEGTVVSVKLKADGDKLTGTSSSSEGTYTIEGSRVKRL